MRHSVNSHSLRIWVATILFAGIACLLSSCSYMKMNPPADNDKVFVPGVANNSCWNATAANMLAGAGYGDGTTVQARAADIYGDMIAQYTTVPRGWPDAALSWWLGSANNTWPSNPYTVVTVYGTKTMNPWNDPNGAREIGNQLRQCNFVGLAFSWPTNAPGVVGTGGHATTAWGDGLWAKKNDSSPITTNPTRVIMTDSDRDTGGDVQEYIYDTFTNPNPGGANEGNGWYFNFDANHPYLRNITVLSPADRSSGAAGAQRVVGSYKIKQTNGQSATDLHYTVGTDVDILSYHTWLDRETPVPPDIQEHNPRRGLDVDWDLTDKPVKQGEDVTITTEFILPSWNAIYYRDVHFTYPRFAGAVQTDLMWEIQTPIIEDAVKIPNVTGGYVVGSFEVIDPRLPAGKQLVGEYRLIHQYSYNQSPEQHVFSLAGSEGYRVVNIRFGHSYGYPNRKELWDFSEWMTSMMERSYELSEDPVKIEIDWRGRLPYPDPGSYYDRLPDIKDGLSTDPKKR